MSKFSNTVAIPVFKSTNGIKDLHIDETPDGKPYFCTDNGIEGKVSIQAATLIESGDLSNVRVSTFDPEEVGKSPFFMIHLSTGDKSNHKRVCTI